MSLLEKGRGLRDRPRRRGPGPLLGALLLAAALAGAAYLYLGRASSGQRKRVAGLEALSARLMAETVPLRFMVLSCGEAGLRARIRLYDLSGRELALLEKDLPGAELFLDFLLSPLPGAGAGEERWLAFPYRVFTEALPAAEGILLLDSYDRSGFPAVFEGAAEGGAALDPAERAALAAVFARAREAAGSGEAPASREAGGPAPPRSAGYGSAVHDVSAFSRFEVGVVYRIVCRAKGGIEIMED